MPNEHFVEFTDEDTQYIISKINPFIKNNYEESISKIDNVLVTGFLNVCGIDTIARLKEDPEKESEIITRLEKNIEQMTKNAAILNPSIKSNWDEYKKACDGYDSAQTDEEKKHYQMQMWAHDGR